VLAPLEPRVVSRGFNERVYRLVRKIPAGRVATYGQIATLLGSPRVARHVGFAMAACLGAREPVPWHRVINSQGCISHRGDVARAHEQRERLEAEGVVFDDRERVDLKTFKAHGLKASRGSPLANGGRPVSTRSGGRRRS
jgi:methylated-DNA-protein-cysteine methyltransferase related protein